MRNYEYLMDKTVARETPVVYPPGTARAARACKDHMWWQIVHKWVLVPQPSAGDMLT